MGEARRKARRAVNATDRAFAEATMRELAVVLTRELPQGVGFAVTLFNFTDDPDARWSTYASNGQRDSLIRYFGELIEHLRTGENSIPMAGVPARGSESS